MIEREKLEERYTDWPDSLLFFFFIHHSAHKMYGIRTIDLIEGRQDGFFFFPFTRRRSRGYGRRGRNLATSSLSLSLSCAEFADGHRVHRWLASNRSPPLFFFFSFFSLLHSLCCAGEGRIGPLPRALGSPSSLFFSCPRALVQIERNLAYFLFFSPFFSHSFFLQRRPFLMISGGSGNGFPPSFSPV